MTDSTLQESIDRLKKDVIHLNDRSFDYREELANDIQAVLAALKEAKQIGLQASGFLEQANKENKRLQAELNKHREFMKAYYKWAFKVRGSDAEEFQNMVMAAEAVPPEEE